MAHKCVQAFARLQRPDTDRVVIATAHQATLLVDTRAVEATRVACQSETRHFGVEIPEFDLVGVLLVEAGE